MMKKLLLCWALLLGTGLGVLPGRAQGVEWASTSANSSLSGSSRVYQVAVDAAGNTYTAGGSTAGVVIGGLAPAQQLGTGIMFVVKRNPAGQVLWVRRGGATATIPLALALDGAGQPVVAGTFTNTTTLGGTTLTSAGGTDGFVARLDAAGNWLGAVKLGGPRDDRPTALAVQSDGTAFLTGTFVQSAIFGSLPTLNATSSNISDTDLFVARLSPTNTWTWAIREGTNRPELSNGLAVDGLGRVTVSGSFIDSLQLDTLPILYARSRRVTGASDIFVAQLSSATGAWQWATRAGGPGGDIGYGLAVDAAGTISMAATFQDTLDFGDSLALPRVASRGGNDALVARLSPTGTWLWATGAGGSGGAGGTLYGDVGLAVAVDPAGTRTTVTGRFTGIADFGPGVSALTAHGSATEIFIAQAAGTDGHWLNATALGTIGVGNQPGGVALSADGHVYATGAVTRGIYFGTDRYAGPDITPARYPGDNGFGAALAYMGRLAPDAGTWDQVLRFDHGANLEVRATDHDAAGNTYVAGIFDGSATFDTPAGLVRLTSTAGQDAFVGKLNAAGQWQWVLQSTAPIGTDSDGATGIAVDANGRVTVAGTFAANSFRMGGFTVSGRMGNLTGIVSSGTLFPNNGFVAQFDAATGAGRWLTTLESTSDAMLYSLSRDPLTNDLTVAGGFSGTVSTTGPGSFSVTATGSYDGLLARLSPTGTWQWLRRAGAATPTTNGNINNLLWTQIRQDASGAYTLTGLVRGTVQVGSQSFTAPVPAGAIQHAPIVARLAATGSTWAWATQSAGTFNYKDGIYASAATDAAGNTYFADYVLNSPAVRKYSPTGSLLWSAPTSPNVTGQALAVDAAGDVTVLGSFSQSATFGSTTLTAATLGQFAAHISSAGTWRWATSLGSGNATMAMTPAARSVDIINSDGTTTIGGFYIQMPLGRQSSTTVGRPVVARLLPPPIITSFTPGSGLAGTVVVLTGSGFTDATEVAFNGATATGFVVSNGGTTITVTVPAAATTGLITVTSAGGTGSSPSNFIVPLPAITWTGALSTAWDVAGNWLPPIVPTSTTDATIPPVPNQPLVTVATATCANLTVQAGATVTIIETPATGYLTVHKQLDAAGDFVMTGGILETRANAYFNGSFTATGGTVRLMGTGTTEVGRNGGVVGFWNLTVGPGGVRQDGAFRVKRMLTLQGMLDTNNKELTLLSDATGTAMVVNDGGAVSGIASMQRYIGGPNAGVGYRHFSSPMVATNVSSLLIPGFTAVTNPNYNTVGNTARPFPNIFGFAEPRQGAAGLPGPVGFDQAWYSPSNNTAVLVRGRGYTVNVAGSRVATVSGVLSTGTVSVGLPGGSATGPLTHGGTGPFAGYHLLGNPYPSPIDWDNMAKPAGLDNAVYVFRSTGQYTGTYDYYVNNIGTLAGGEIAIGQGFFVRVSQAVSAFSFTDAARKTSYTNPTFQRGTADARPLLKLTLRPAAGGDADAAFVYFEAGATTGFDGYFDALKLPNPNGLALATVLGADRYAVNGLPTLGAAPQVLPLALSVPTAGTYELATEQLLNFAPGTTLYLHDALLNTLTLLTPATRYAFTLAGPTAPSRFTVEFRPAGALATAAQVLAAQVQLWPTPATAGTGATVAAPAQAIVTLCNVLGQQLHPALIVGPTGTVPVPTAGLAAGVYVLRVRTATSETSRRLVLE